MTRRWLSVAREEGGNSAIELALIAPVLAIFLGGMVDISRATAERLTVEQAAQRAIERQMQGQEASKTFANLAADAAAGAGVLVSAVTVTPWRECNGAIVGTGATYAASTCSVGQTEAAYVRVAVRKNFTPTFSASIFPGANADGTVTLVGQAGVRIQ
jgi:Flp pilus assembly protein TadG